MFGLGEQGPSPVKTELFASKRANFQISNKQTKMITKITDSIFPVATKIMLTHKMIALTAIPHN